MPAINDQLKVRTIFNCVYLVSIYLYSSLNLIYVKHNLTTVYGEFMV